METRVEYLTVECRLLDATPEAAKLLLGDGREVWLPWNWTKGQRPRVGDIGLVEVDSFYAKSLGLANARTLGD